MNKNIGQKILEKIKKKNLEPKAKWKFILKNSFIWFFGIATLVIGGLAFSVIIYLLKNNDWSFHRQMSGSLIKFVIITFPYFWILCFILFIFLALYNLQHTKKGYKYQIITLLIICFVISFLLGLFLHSFKTGRLTDDILSQRFPPYNQLINRKVEMWGHPEKGLLAGQIISVEDGQHFQIKDFNNKFWQIELKKSFISEIKPEQGQMVRMVGKILDNQIFQAEKCMIGPYKKWPKENFKPLGPIRPSMPPMSPDERNERNLFPMRINE